MNYILFMIITIVLEILLLHVVDNVYDKRKRKNKVLFFLIFGIYIALALLLFIACFSYIKTGQIQTGIKVLLSNIILCVSVYVLFIRKILNK